MPSSATAAVATVALLATAWAGWSRWIIQQAGAASMRLAAGRCRPTMSRCIAQTNAPGVMREGARMNHRSFWHLGIAVAVAFLWALGCLLWLGWRP
jgi:hypothetical protein